MTRGTPMVNSAKSMNYPASRTPQPSSVCSSSFVDLPWKDLRPVIAGAVYLVFWPTEGAKSWRQSDWVIDYNFNPLGRVGVDTSAGGRAARKAGRQVVSRSPRWWPRLQPT